MGFNAAELEALAGEVGTVVDQAQVIPVSEQNTLHIDGDYAAYFFAGNDDLAFGVAKANMISSFKSAAAVLGVFNHNVTVHITDPLSDKGGRYKIATVRGYQDKRTHSQRPKNWQALRDYLHEGMPGSGLRLVNWTDREADDGASYAARLDRQIGRIPGLYYRDKDWKMIPGRHLRWTDFEVIDTLHNQFSVVVDDEGEPSQYGHKFFWLQMLMGDTVDNIPGLERIVYINSKGKEATKLCGEKCAAENLDGVASNEEAYDVVAAAYENFYGPGWEAKFSEQAMLLWLRNDDRASIANFLSVVPLDADAYPGLVKAVQHISRRTRQ